VVHDEDDVDDYVVIVVDLSWIHTGDKVKFNTVNFVKTCQNCPCHFGRVHTGDKVERTFDIWATKITHF